MYYYIVGTLLALMLIWVIGSYLVIWSIEEPAYKVIEQKDGYEIREYAPYIKAEVTVTGSYDEATRQGFRLIADYIFGNNVAKESISMTTPVLEATNAPTSEKIAMTTPVLETATGNTSRNIAFVLPSKYTLDTLPRPNNNAVSLVAVPTRTVAVLRFTWYPTATRIAEKTTLLQTYLGRDRKKGIGSVETARYNPPLSMPLTLRNEIIIPIE